MTTVRSEFLKIMQERGFLNQCTDLEGLDAKLMAGGITAYIGFDATAPSLHVGSLLPIMMLYWLQQTGNKPIVLMGGGTTKVGDPSGKDESRKLLTDDGIASNMAGIKKVFAKYLTFGDGKTDAIMVNNDDWLSELRYIDFLRDFGRHFTINRMMTFDSVKLRLEREQPLTFLEFNYMIMQAYDFYELNKRHNCILQLGASDQWGNIINGVELTRRASAAESFGFTCPLLTKSDGTKMGKSASGAIWLNEDMLPAYDFYQYLRNVDDADVGKLLRLLTTLPMDEITRLENLRGAEINDAKKILAATVTKLCHGEQAANDAAEAARKTFEEGNLAAAPKISRPLAELNGGIALMNILVEEGIFKSNGEFRRKVQEGAVRVDGEKITDPQLMLGTEILNRQGMQITVSVGKKHHYLLAWGG